MVGTLRFRWGQARTWLEERDAALRLVAQALVFLIPLLYLAIGLLRAAPFVDDVPIDSTEGDDWVTYKTYAHSILTGGLTMPILGPYAGTVHGFLYNYFLAGLFFLFSENSSYVYVVQSFLLGASVSLFFLSVRQHLSRPGTIALLICMAVYLYLDLYRYLAFRLLSENLTIFLTAAFLLAAVRAYARPGPVRAALAGILLGTLVLGRTSLVGAGMALVLAGVAYAALSRRTLLPAALVLAVAFALTMGLLPLREYAATGRPELDLITSTHDWIRPPTDSVGSFVEHYVRRALFTFGFATTLSADYRPRPQWMLPWVLFAGYLLHLIRRRRTPALWEWVCLIFVVFYLGPVVLAGDPVNYGGRMLVVGMPLVLLLGVSWADEAATRSPGDALRAESSK